MLKFRRFVALAATLALLAVVAPVAAADPSGQAVLQGHEEFCTNAGTGLGEEVTGGLIFRRGAPDHPKTFQLRPDDEGRLSFRDSLSNPLSMSKRPIFKPGDEYFAVDTARLPRGSYVYDGGGHVSVTASQEQILRAIVDTGRFPI